MSYTHAYVLQTLWWTILVGGLPWNHWKFQWWWTLSFENTRSKSTSSLLRRWLDQSQFNKNKGKRIRVLQNLTHIRFSQVFVKLTLIKSLSQL